MLSPGSRLGPYQIVSLLGAGGMGEVYRARDSALRRDVAVKVLLEAFASDPERLARFQREAEILAALNHPNIAHIHGLHESGVVRAIVMELVEGPTLADRIAAGPVPFDESLTIATQIAEALEAAHDRGIIHRDLKPANIKIRNDGTVKVLDFGLAKAATSEASPDLSQSPTITLEGTRAGVVLGTAAYMSPEQARGRPLDKRTDVWSFGCVLFEMMTGRAAFSGETVTDITAAIVGREPDWNRLPASMPEAIRRLLKRCLEKDHRKRLRDIGDARLELEAARAWTGDIDTVTVQRRRPWWMWTAAALGVLSLVMAFALWRREEPATALQNPLANATFTRLTDFEGTEHDAAVSPDGRFVAFQSDRDGPFDTWVTQVGSGGFANLTRGKEDASGAVQMVGFSVDGSEILLGGLPPSRRLRSIPLLGGTARPFLAGPAGVPRWSADGTRLVYPAGEPGDPVLVAGRTGVDPKQIYIHPRPDGHNHYPIWSPDGRWIYFVSGNWATIEMDLWRMTPSGSNHERLTYHDNNVSHPSFIDERTLLYLSPADDGSGPWLWALDVESRASRRVSFGLEKYTSLSVSADGRRLAATVSNPTASVFTVPILDRPAREDEVRPFALPTVRALAPRIGPSTSLFYLSSRGAGDGLWRYQSGEAVEIWKGAEGALFEAPAVSSDGRVAIVLRRQGKRLLHIMSADGSGLRPLTDALDVQGSVSWSHDGTSIAAGGTATDGSGLFTIAVANGIPTRIASGPASNAVWSQDGNLIVYSGRLVAVSAPLLAVRPDGTEVKLPEIRVRVEGERFRFMPDGRGLVYMTGPHASQNFQLLDVATLKSRALTELQNPATMRTFDITLDGKAIVFDRMNTNSDIVLIDLPPRQ